MSVSLPGAMLRRSTTSAITHNTSWLVLGLRQIVAWPAVSVLLLYASAAWAQSGGVEHLAGRSIIPLSQADDQLAGPTKLSVDLIEKGSSSRRQRAQAIQDLPLQQLSPDARSQVQQVLNSVSLYRRLPTLRVRIDPRAYAYFAEHPDVAVSIWRAMQISRVQLNRTSPAEFQTDTLDGTSGNVTVLHRTASSQLVLCDGQFHSPALPRSIRAVAVLHLQSRPSIDPAAGPSVTHSVDMFVSFPSQAVETIARIVSPVSYHIADRNFEEISLFLEMMQLAMSRQPGWVEQISTRLDGVAPDSRHELLKVTAAVYVDSQRRLLQLQGVPVSLEAIQPPTQSR